jgi:3-oxoacyl-[acyl-carrier-protein] synthase III
MGFKVKAVGHALGERILTNHELAQRIDTSHEWIMERTGISERHISDELNTSDLGTLALKNACERYEVDIQSIEAIIVATMTPDHFTPSTASLIQAKMGLNPLKIMAFDVNVACSGFVVAIDLASALLESKRFKRIAIIGAEVFSKIIDWNDRTTCILFGDGAGAMIVDFDEHAKKAVCVNHSEGDLDGTLQACGVPLLGEDNHPLTLTMQGKDVYRFAVDVIPSVMIECAQKANITLESLDHVILHQANQRIMDYAMKRLNLDPHKSISNIAKVGNTSAASIPIAISMALIDGSLTHGEHVMVVGFGGGLSYGAASFTL